ncbi:MAG: hypothetical protein HY735_25290 [Verrucomicrobia bacterium]|nr:hypothetical protein [Verrucomicrobiota bacterium]
MTAASCTKPDASTGDPKLAINDTSTRLVRKKVVASANSVSVRLVDDWMTKGCPYIKPSPRLTLFDLAEVAEWLKKTYGVRKRGQANSSTGDRNGGA